MASPFFERLCAALAPDYELVRELASGGMATVYLAREVALDRLVAVKVLRPELYTADAAAQFEREAQILAKLRHSTIVVVHKFEPRRGLHLYMMEHLEGDTLQGALATRGRLTQHGALKLGRDLLEALEVAHRAWRRASLLERGRGERGDLCRAYGAVARNWAAGEPRYRARADSAAHRFRALQCPGAP